MCANGMLSLFGIAKLPIMADSDPSTQGDPKIEELIDKFKIPRDASKGEHITNFIILRSTPCVKKRDKRRCFLVCANKYIVTR